MICEGLEDFFLNDTKVTRLGFKIESSASRVEQLPSQSPEVMRKNEEFKTHTEQIWAILAAIDCIDNIFDWGFILRKNQSLPECGSRSEIY